MSTWVAEVELADSFAPVPVTRPLRRLDSSARVLVRLHRQVLGLVSIPFPDGAHSVDPGALAEAVQAQLGDTLARHLREDGLASGMDEAGLGGWSQCAHHTNDRAREPITVVVCTRDRPAALAACLGGLLKLRYHRFEVVVVDNAPSSEEPRACFDRLVGADPRFRYVMEPLPGLSRARNRALQEATHRLVAFTDDDVRVDPWWLEAIATGFGRDATVGCVTGLVPPAELDHPAQHYFDRRYSWSRHFEAKVYDLGSGRDASPLYPYSAGLFGTGANFAVDGLLMRRLGAFDEALGAGTPAGGGEDLDAFVRVLRSGHSIVYEPSALVWHVHRADAAAQRRQLFYYGVGLTAFLAKHLVDRRTALELLRRLPEGARRMPQLWAAEQLQGRAPVPLVLAEVAGMVTGPVAYARGRRRLRPAAGRRG